MAISFTHWQILKELKARGVLPQGGRILEIGEANWYGDCDPSEILSAIPGELPSQTVVDKAKEMLGDCDSFSVAKVMYSILFKSKKVDSIDLDPTRPDALKCDLNQPITAAQLDAHHRYDVAYNHGTAEHIFNIAQVFRTMHDATQAGGLLIHESPFTGWVDHGFYCLQPTLFWDVAAANDYKMEFVGVEHLASRTWFEVESREQLLEMKQRDQLPDNAMLFVVMRKQLPQEFKIPQQGIYAGNVSRQAQAAWRELR